MPSGRPELHRRYGDDGVAWGTLEQVGWTEENFVLIPPPDSPDPNDWSIGECDAVEYLLDEWDWDLKRAWLEDK